MARLDDPAKNWKFSSADMAERGFCDEYMQAYEDMIRNTAAPHAPWYVIPADNKWFARFVVAAAVIDTLPGLGLDFPKADKQKRRELALAKKELS
jgi:polyphosphate kinase 2 (PPK2 family)